MRLNAIMWLVALPIAIVMFSTANARDGVYGNVFTMLGYYLPAAGIPIAIVAAFYFLLIRPKDTSRAKMRKAPRGGASDYWTKPPPSNDP